MLEYICASFDESNMISNYLQDPVKISNLYYKSNLDYKNEEFKLLFFIQNILIS